MLILLTYTAIVRLDSLNFVLVALDDDLLTVIGLLFGVVHDWDALISDNRFIDARFAFTAGLLKDRCRSSGLI